MNQTIISMLRTLPDFHKNEWKDHFKKLVFACKYMKHSTSGYLPYYIMFDTSNRYYPTNIYREHIQS